MSKKHNVRFACGKVTYGLPPLDIPQYDHGPS